MPPVQASETPTDPPPTPALKAGRICENAEEYGYKYASKRCEASTTRT